MCTDTKAGKRMKKYVKMSTMIFLWVMELYMILIYFILFQCFQILYNTRLLLYILYFLKFKCHS